MTRRLCLSLCAPLLALALLAVPALALGAANHPFLATITGYEDACGVAQGAGKVYVSDYYHDAVDVLNPNSTPTPFERVAQIANEDPGDGPCGLAVDSSGDLYVNNYRGDVVKYLSSELSAGSGTVIDPGPATGIAVDPASGNVYVDRGTYIAEYEPSGALVTKIGVGGSLREGYGVAVSDYAETTGDVYVADAAEDKVKVYNPSEHPATPISVINGVATPQSGFKYLGESELAVDSEDGHVFVLDEVGHDLSEHPEAVVDEFNAAGDYRGQIVAGIVDSEPSGIAIEGSSGNVYVTSGNTEGSKVFEFGPTAPAHTLKVTKTGGGGGTVSTIPLGIDCGEACTAEYNEEELLTLFAAPDGHSVFTGWTVTGAEPCLGTGTCSVSLGADVEVHANFEEPTQKTLDVSVTGSGEATSVPAGIACRAGAGSCSEHFNEGRIVTLTATAPPHNRLHAWSGCGSEPSPTKCEVTMGEAKSVSAEFEEIPQKTLSVNASGEGTVTSVPTGIECGAGGAGSCSEHFDEGSTVNLRAKPEPHNELTAWSGCESEPSPTECNVTISAAKSVNASFAPIHHILTVAILGEGSVSADHGAVSGCTATAGDCAGSYEEGEAVTLIATPAAGSAFAGFSGGCGGTGPCRLTLSTNTAVTANFAEIPTPPIEILPAHLTLGKPTVKGATATLQVSVSGPGSLIASGNDLKGSNAQPAAAGPLTLNLALNGAGQRALRKAKQRKLKVKVALIFTPSDGAAAVAATQTVAFKAKSR